LYDGEVSCDFVVGLSGGWTLTVTAVVVVGLLWPTNVLTSAMAAGVNG
jgi:hypothetical protein